MKKTIFSFIGLFLISLASVLALEPVTETYSQCCYSYDYSKLAYNWNQPYKSPIEITWSAEPIEQATSGDSLHYKVIVIIRNTQNFLYYSWAIGLLGGDEFVSCEDVSFDSVFTKTNNDFGVSPIVTPAGSSKLMLSEKNVWNSLGSLEEMAITYEASVAAENAAITAPDQIIFSAFSCNYVIQRDPHSEQSTVVDQTMH